MYGKCYASSLWSIILLWDGIYRTRQTPLHNNSTVQNPFVVLSNNKAIDFSKQDSQEPKDKCYTCITFNTLQEQLLIEYVLIGLWKINNCYYRIWRKNPQWTNDESLAWKMALQI